LNVRACISFLVLLLLASTAFAEPCGFGGTESDFHGYRQFDFALEGRACKVACPKEAAPGKPWVWRALFWGHEPQTDIALLGKGFHVAYIDVFEFHGNDTAIKIFDNLYAFLTEQHGFAKRPALEGLSRGGLIAYNWASEHPDQVSCIYGDAPVCDIKSWPGGLGAGQGSPEDWKVCLAAWGLDETTVKDFKRNPIDRLAPLAKAGIPLLHVVGDADDVVPVKENTDVLAERYRALGGTIEIINKPGVGHHPHSLVDPTPIVDFIVAYAAGAKN
jgi:pimeloyl-ACP methyl ester carboxylesterase